MRVVLKDGACFELTDDEVLESRVLQQLQATDSSPCLSLRLRHMVVWREVNYGSTIELQDGFVAAQVSHFLATSVNAAAAIILDSIFACPTGADLPSTQSAWRQFCQLPSGLRDDILCQADLPLRAQLRLAPKPAEGDILQSRVHTLANVPSLRLELHDLLTIRRHQPALAALRRNRSLTLFSDRSGNSTEEDFYRCSSKSVNETLSPEGGELLGALVETLTALESITISTRSESDAVAPIVAALAKLPCLKSVDFSPESLRKLRVAHIICEEWACGEDSLEALMKNAATRLHTLRVRLDADVCIDDFAGWLRPAVALRHLFIDPYDVESGSDTFWAAISSLTALTHLEVWLSPCFEEEEEDLSTVRAAVAKLTALHTLGMYGEMLSGATMPDSLRTLRLRLADEGGPPEWQLRLPAGLEELYSDHTLLVRCDIDFEAIMQWLQPVTALRSLKIPVRDLCAANVDDLRHISLPPLAALTSLVLTFYSIVNEDILDGEILCDSLAPLTALHELRLRAETCQAGNSWPVPLARMRRLRHFELQSPAAEDFKQRGVLQLAAQLSIVTALEELVLAGQELCGLGLEAIARQLHHMPHMTKLALDGQDNESEESAQALAESIPTTVRHLQLTDCVAPDDSGAVLSMLSSLSKLTCLQLFMFETDEAATETFAMHATALTALQRLEWHANAMYVLGLEDLALALPAFRKTLTWLALSGFKFIDAADWGPDVDNGEDDAVLLARGLRGFARLEGLRLLECEMSDEDIQALMRTVATLPSLRLLSLPDHPECTYRDETIEALNEALDALPADCYFEWWSQMSACPWS